MSKVAKDAELRNEFASQFGKEPRKSVENSLRNVMGKRGVPLERKEALEKLAKSEGMPDFLEGAKDYATKEAFSRADVQGSRRVNFARTFGMALDKLFPQGKGIGEVGAATAGFAGDQYGPAMAKKILDLSILAQKTPIIGSALRASGQQGYKNFLATDAVLRKMYPEYDQVMTPVDEDIDLESILDE
jgi:hypothetical protein